MPGLLLPNNDGARLSYDRLEDFCIGTSSVIESADLFSDCEESTISTDPGAEPEKGHDPTTASCELGVDSCLVHQKEGIPYGHQRVMSAPTTSLYDNTVLEVMEYYAERSLIEQLETLFEQRSVVEDVRESVLDSVCNDRICRSWLPMPGSRDWQQIKESADRSLSSMCLRATLIPEWAALTTAFKPLCQLKFKMKDHDEELNCMVDLPEVYGVEMPQGSDREDRPDGTVRIRGGWEG